MMRETEAAGLAERMLCAQAGDREGRWRPPRGHRPLVLGWLRRWLADSVDLADMYQDMLVHLHRARHTYDPAPPFERWLFAIHVTAPLTTRVAGVNERGTFSWTSCPTWRSSWTRTGTRSPTRSGHSRARCARPSAC
jgi:hypothetical protein